MNQKLKKSLMIAAPIILLGGAIGSGIGIGLNINQNLKLSDDHQQKRQTIINQRLKANSLVDNYIKEYIKTPAFTSKFTWKPEYTALLESSVYSVENNIDINKPWYENYGPLYQSDQIYYKGKLILWKKNGTLNAYRWVRRDTTKPLWALIYPLHIIKCNDNTIENASFDMTIVIDAEFPSDDF